MATNLLPLTPVMIRAGSGSGLSSEKNRRRSSSGSTSSNWWAPLFGISSEPDYIGSADNVSLKKEAGSDSDLEPKPSRSSYRFTPGCFTEEKAKQLRLLTTDTSSFHDVMYHSAIASRLATDIKRRSDV
ncbi:uncharacterized protein LOC126672856 [Mercurialis annua]|uniref:uncharacterized protein LOC126672856 n=1 Tax=Mercurialis annua TaxID=3986 RepID=UPI0021605F55|nr:uncharacterized protein LOC126672856 [Mercurialis annua]